MKKQQRDLMSVKTQKPCSVKMPVARSRFACAPARISMVVQKRPSVHL